MNGCYLGRGTLLVSVLGTSRGFFPLAGQAEVNLLFQEDNESVVDGRHGVNERVDWYVRNYRVRLESECFDIRTDALEQLMKTVHTTVPAGAGSYDLPQPLVLGSPYFVGQPKLSAVTIEDSTAAPVSAGDYSVDAPYGLVTFTTDPGLVPPYTVSFDYGTYDAFALSTRSPIVVQALFKGVNKVTGKEVMAHFYRLTLDIGEELKLVQKPYSGIVVRLQATPDVAAPLDPTLGQYGRILQL
jgi:hypothetical protein